MDIDQSHFQKKLLPILQNIANATFVSFDLEMSGISTKPKYSSGERSHNVGKPTLQQQYEDMKNAAETFQIVQLGITCVEEDREKGKTAYSESNSCAVDQYHHLHVMTPTGFGNA